MLGITTASRLNVRSKPDKSSNKRGVLPKGTVVSITGCLDDWMEFRYKDHPAYLYKPYVSLLNNDRHTSATVTARLLNVRSKPDIRASILGKLPLASRVDIISLLPQWAEIYFNDGIGYVWREYIQLQRMVGSLQGKVRAGVLNVRSRPTTGSPKLGQLLKNALVTIQGRTGDWLQIHYNGLSGYIHTKYVEELASGDDKAHVGPADIAGDAPPIPSTIINREYTLLSPERRLPLGGDATARNVSRTWNQYGNLLLELCDRIDIDVACAVAVLCVESAGQGFKPSNHGRMIIRFENHKFWKFWGSDHQDVFRRHFVFQSGKVWQGHRWRRDVDDSWQSFHGDQELEWRVLNFARTFNDDAALYSISMGAPQIMGFHFARIGYPTVQAMFEDFAGDIEAHIRGLFNFLDTRMVAALKTLDFVGFAASYNGSGQKEVYGRWIKDHYESFKLLKRTYSL